MRYSLFIKWRACRNYAPKVGDMSKSLQESFEDKLIKAKLRFFKSISEDFEPALREFQSPESKLPFLYSAKVHLLKTLLGRVFH